MYCSYCNGLGHKITECDKDLHLKDIIYADVEPDFRVATPCTKAYRFFT